MNDNDIAYQKEVRLYLFKAFIYEFSKILIFMVIAIYFHIFKEYLAALFFLVILRSTGGGLHLKHYSSCLLVSLIVLFASILLGAAYHPDRWIMILTLLIGTIIGQHLVPITSSNRPPANETQVKHSKRNTTIILLIISAMICICPLNIYLYIGFWTVIIHILQLIIAHKKGGFQCLT